MKRTCSQYYDCRGSICYSYVIDSIHEGSLVAIQVNVTPYVVKSTFCLMLTSNRPVDAKVVAVVSFPIPSNRKQLMQSVGMMLHYRKFC